MKTFHIVVHPVEGLEAVKIGFSWPACFFGCLWMLEKGLWGPAALWFGSGAAAHVVVALAERGAGSAPSALLSFATTVCLAVIAGANANRWREQQLRKRRYEHLTTVAAQTPYEAIEQAFGSTRPRWDFETPAARQS
jgi:hypothetical protein